MKLIIAGCRDRHGIGLIDAAVAACPWPEEEIELVIHGGASGVDLAAKTWAECRDVPWIEFPAYWETLGKSAGPRRNEAMAEEGDALLALWDGKSRGTQNMIETAVQHGLPVYIHSLKPHPLP